MFSIDGVYKTSFRSILAQILDAKVKDYKNSLKHGFSQQILKRIRVFFWITFAMNKKMSIFCNSMWIISYLSVQVWFFTKPSFFVKLSSGDRAINQFNILYWREELREQPWYDKWLYINDTTVTDFIPDPITVDHVWYGGVAAHANLGNLFSFSKDPESTRMAGELQWWAGKLEGRGDKRRKVSVWKEREEVKRTSDPWMR